MSAVDVIGVGINVAAGNRPSLVWDAVMGGWEGPLQISSEDADDKLYDIAEVAVNEAVCRSPFRATALYVGSSSDSFSRRERQRPALPPLTER
ncbi:hypothetical protein LCGC14_1122020, partial [marine sediment metagenome]